MTRFFSGRRHSCEVYKSTVLTNLIKINMMLLFGNNRTKVLLYYHHEPETNMHDWSDLFKNMLIGHTNDLTVYK